MSIIHLKSVGSEEPTAADLLKIELEWPVIAADLDLLDAEIALIKAGPFASVMDWRRVRRAERRVMDAARDLADRDVVAEVVA